MNGGSDWSGILGQAQAVPVTVTAAIMRVRGGAPRDGARSRRQPGDSMRGETVGAGWVRNVMCERRRETLMRDRGCSCHVQEARRSRARQAHRCRRSGATTGPKVWRGSWNPKIRSTAFVHERENYKQWRYNPLTSPAAQYLEDDNTLSWRGPTQVLCSTAISSAPAAHGTCNRSRTDHSRPLTSRVDQGHEP